MRYAKNVFFFLSTDFKDAFLISTAETVRTCDMLNRELNCECKEETDH